MTYLHLPFMNVVSELQWSFEELTLIIIVCIRDLDKLNLAL